jgi:hypothetical protein
MGHQLGRREISHDKKLGLFPNSNSKRKNIIGWLKSLSINPTLVENPHQQTSKKEA